MQNRQPDFQPDGRMSRLPCIIPAPWVHHWEARPWALRTQSSISRSLPIGAVNSAVDSNAVTTDQIYFGTTPPGGTSPAPVMSTLPIPPTGTSPLLTLVESQPMQLWMETDPAPPMRRFFIERRSCRWDVRIEAIRTRRRVPSSSSPGIGSTRTRPIRCQPTPRAPRELPPGPVWISPTAHYFRDRLTATMVSTRAGFRSTVNPWI